MKILILAATKVLLILAEKGEKKLVKWYMLMNQNFFIKPVVQFNNEKKNEETTDNMATHVIPGLDAEVYHLLNDIALREIPTNVAACEKVMSSLQLQLALTEKEAATMLLAIAAASSPAQIDDAVIETALNHVAPAGIVEIVVRLSVLQFLHRLNCYYSLIKTF